VKTVAAAELIAETGVDMTRFPSAAHLVSWAKFSPQIHQSAGKSMSKAAAGATPGWPARSAASSSRTLVPTPSSAPAIGASRTAVAKPKAIMATGNSILTVRYHLLSDLDTEFCDLGPGYFRIPDQHAPPRPRPRHPTAGTHRPTHRIRDGKAVVTDIAAWYPNLARQNNVARLRRAPPARPLTIRFSGQSCPLVEIDTLVPTRIGPGLQKRRPQRWSRAPPRSALLTNPRQISA
jgi:hypothetical protein